MATRKSSAAATPPPAPAGPSLGQTIDIVAKDKGIDRAVFMEAIHWDNAVKLYDRYSREG